MTISPSLLTQTVAGSQSKNLVELSVLRDELEVYDKDTKLARLIASVGAAFTNELGFVPWRATNVESLAGFGRPLLFLGQRPIESVTSVTLNGATVDSSTYSLARSQGSTLSDCLYRESGWAATYQATGGIVGGAMPLAYSLDYAVTYIAGWRMPGESATGSQSALPGDLAEAALRQCHDWFKYDAMDPSVAAESIGPHTIRYHGGKSGGVGLVGLGGRMLSPSTIEVIRSYR